MSTIQYTKEHTWIKIEGKKGTIGVTSYALEQLGDVVYLELPQVGRSFQAQETFGSIESTKTVSDLYMPESGKVTEINEDIVASPEKITEDPYEKGWLIKIEVTGNMDKLLSESEYKNYISKAN